MTELPAEVREKAARAAFMTSFNESTISWGRVVDAVVEVLAEHQAQSGDSSATVVNELRAKAAHQAGTTGLLPFARLDKARQEYWRGLAEGTVKVAELEASRDKLEWATREILKARGVVDVELEKVKAERDAMARSVERQRQDASKQRKRRKAVEAKVAEMAETSNAAIAGLTNYDRRCREIAAERDALQARVGKLRAALVAVDANGCCEGESWDSAKTCLATGDVRCGACEAHAALTTDDRAAGRTEES